MAPRYEADYLPDDGSDAVAGRPDQVSDSPVSAAPVDREAPTVPAEPHLDLTKPEPRLDLTKVERDEPAEDDEPVSGAFETPPGDAPPAAPPGGMPPGGVPPGGVPPGGFMGAPWGAGPPPGGPGPGGPAGPGGPGGFGGFGGFGTAAGGVPPFGSGFTRGNLVRPQQGRYVAGVCAAIGRATNTDPTLWRVIFAVLTLAGGVSIVAYLLGWLLLPAEGDTGSPLEALLGRGRSTTSAPLAIVIGVGAVLAFLLVMSRNVGAAAVGLAVVIGVVALLVRGQGNLAAGPQPDQVADRPGPPLGPFTPQPAPATAMPFPPSVPPFQPAPPTYTGSGGDSTGGAPRVHPAWMQQQTAMTQPVLTAPPAPLIPPPIPPVPPLPPMAPSGYRAPFAPHGPFGGQGPYAASLGHPGGPPGTPYPGLAPMPPKPPKPPKVRSRLGRVIFSLICLSLGVLAVLEVTAFDFLVSTYFAVPLAIVALGLIVGARFGRARIMILVGVVLSLALAISTASDMNGFDRSDHIESYNIHPLTVDDLNGDYRTDIGDIRADLTQVDFTGHNVDVSFQVRYSGNITIIVPPNVDVYVKVRVQGGQCTFVGRDCSGFNQNNEFTDAGADGVGGGRLHLDLDIGYGNLEVTR